MKKNNNNFEAKNEKWNLKKNKQNIVKIVNAKIKNDEMRKGLWRDKYEIANRKMRIRCKEEKTNYVVGGWKPDLKICSTKSQWQWKMENKINETGKDPLEIPEKKIIIKYGRGPVILYDENNKMAGAYDAEIEKENNNYLVKVIAGNRKIRVRGKKNILEKNLKEEIMAAGEKIILEDLVRSALENNVEIITMIEIEE